MTNIMTRSFRRAAWAAATVGGALSLAACNVEVTNPGPIQAGFLDRTPRGRVATDRAYEYFGLSAPGRGSRLWQ